MSKRKDERQFKVRQLLQEHPKIKISDLSDYFQISSETIRKDIIELENSKIIKKEHGYALLLEEPDEMPISLRNQEYIDCFLLGNQYQTANGSNHSSLRNTQPQATIKLLEAA